LDVHQGEGQEESDCVVRVDGTGSGRERLGGWGQRARRCGGRDGGHRAVAADGGAVPAQT